MQLLQIAFTRRRLGRATRLEPQYRRCRSVGAFSRPIVFAVCNTFCAVSRAMAQSPVDSQPPAETPLSSDKLPQFAVRRIGTCGFRLPQPARSLAFSPDGTRIAVAVDDHANDPNCILIVDARTGAKLQTLSRHEHPICDVAWSSDGALVASASYDGTIRLWNPGTAECVRILRGSFESVDRVSFSPDGTTLFSTHNDASIRVWDVATGVQRQRLGGGDESTNTQLAIAPDGTTLATSNYEVISLWRLPNQKRLAFLRGHTLTVNALAFSPDGATLASAGWDGIIRLWGAAKFDVQRELKEQADTVNAIAFSTDGRILAAGGRNGRILLWDVERGTILRILVGHTDEVCAFAFSRDGRLLASSGEDRTLRVWHTDTWNCTLPDVGHVHGVQSVVFSADDLELFSASLDGTIRGWDPTTGRELSRLSAHRHGVIRSVTDTCGKVFVSAERADDEEDPTAIAVWNVATQQKIRDFDGQVGEVSGIVWMPRVEGFVTSARFDGIRVWDYDSGRLLKSARPSEDALESIAV